MDGRVSRDLTVDVVDAPPRRTVYRRVGKRVFDLCVSLLLMVFLSPMMIAIWVVLTCSLGRGVVLRQERVGRGGRSYHCLKFRTMHHCRRRQSWQYGGPDRRQTHKSSTDPRHTPVGRVLRKYSLDELPQLLNVVGGSMSLVGPRPELERVADERFRQHIRHSTPPGLTGPFQLSPDRSGGDLGRGLGLDVEYVEGVSFRTDVRYLVKTVEAVRRGTGG